MKRFFLLISVVLTQMCWVKSQSEIFRIGAGIADITGPSADIVFLGYVNPTQTGQGIHFRQYARTVIIGDGTNSFVYISLDLGLSSQLLKLEVVKAVKDKYGGKYNINNIVMASTHTHSAPGGYSNYFFYNIATLGFVKQNFEAIMNGILKSIDMAHNSIQNGYVYFNKDVLVDASVNRSPSSYLLNPESERNRYQHDTDKTIQVLKLTNTNGEPIAAVTFFAVHGTSMNNTNRQISGDNKGVASLLFEKAVNPPGTLPGKGKFVALFPNGNLGDISPNTGGAFCSGTMTPCDASPGDCNNKCSECTARGPGRNHEDSTMIIGKKQSDKAKSLFDTATTRLKANVSFIYEAIDMSRYPLPGNVTTCKPAIGYSMFAGATDGPGLPTFCQGIKSPIQMAWNLLFGGKENALWNAIAPTVQTASDALSRCQAPKPILIPTGELNYLGVPLGIPVQPTILPTQIVRIDNVFIAALPGEFTTMAGRRMRDAISTAVGTNIPTEVVLSGLSGTYSQYVTTPEEYMAQRYEAASTLFGNNTLNAYLDQYRKLVTKMKNGVAPDTTQQEPNYHAQAQNPSLNYVLENIPDAPPVLFGIVLRDVNNTYKIGQKASVVFQGANPNNDLRTESTYLTVDKCLNPLCSTVQVIATDGSLETKLIFFRPVPLVGQGQVTIEWTIPSDTTPGTYRIRYFGKSLWNFVGYSSLFKVTL